MESVTRADQPGQIGEALWRARARRNPSTEDIARVTGVAAALLMAIEDSDLERVAKSGERYELAETALPMAIVLLSIAMVARSKWIAIGAVAIAGLGIVTAITTSVGIFI